MSAPRTCITIRLGLAIGALGAAATVTPAWAELAREADIPTLLKTADNVVVGRAASIFAPTTFTIAVDRVIKGANVHSLVVRFDRATPAAGSVSPGQYGIFFLNKRGHFSTYSAVLAATPRIKPPAAIGPLRALARELTAVLSDPGASADQQERAADALRSIPYAVSRAALLKAALHSASAGRIWAAYCVISAGSAADDRDKLSVLDAVARALSDPSPGESYAARRLALALDGRVPEKAVPTLASLLRSRSIHVRRGAAHALADLDSRDAIKPLATVALKDPDREVRFYAVTGLANLTGLRESPQLASFEADDSADTRYWRVWSLANFR